MEHAVVDGNKGGSSWRSQHVFYIVFITMLIVASMFLAETYDRYHPSPNLMLARHILDGTTPQEYLENQEVSLDDWSSALQEATAKKKETDVPDLIDQSSMGIDSEPSSLVDVTHDDPFEVMRRLKNGKRRKKARSSSSSKKAPSTARPLNLVIESPGERPLQAPSGPLLVVAKRKGSGKGKASRKNSKKGKGRTRARPKIVV